MPSLEETSPQRDAPFLVLTDVALFRQIVSWSAGWPGLVAFQLLPSLDPDVLRWRNDTMTATDALLRIADTRTLQAAKRTRWWNAQGQLVTFTLTDATQALRSGNAAATRFVLETAAPQLVLPSQTYRYWSAAVLHSHGRTDVLDVLHEFATRECDRGSVFTFSSDYMLRIQHAKVAGWFVREFGASSLPRELIVTAVCKGHLGLYYYLRKVRGQDFEGARNAKAPTLSAEQQRVRTLITKLHDGTVTYLGNQLLSAAAKADDVELIEQVLADWSQRLGTAAVREATEALQLLRS